MTKPKDEPTSERDRKIAEAAQRALEEADARRAADAGDDEDAPEKEIGGRDGPEPTRFGDWEKKGLISDF